MSWEEKLLYSNTQIRSWQNTDMNKMKNEKGDNYLTVNKFQRDLLYVLRRQWSVVKGRPIIPLIISGIVPRKRRNPRPRTEGTLKLTSALQITIGGISFRHFRPMSTRGCENVTASSKGCLSKDRRLNCTSQNVWELPENV